MEKKVFISKQLLQGTNVVFREGRLRALFPPLMRLCIRSNLASRGAGVQATCPEISLRFALAGSLEKVESAPVPA